MGDDGRGATDARGRFLVLDGIDGCGKSTQARLLVQGLTVPGGEAPLHMREPGSTGAGERIRAILLETGVTLGAASEALLFAAARRQMLDELVRPAVDAGRDVVCERFHASTFAYQAVAGDLDEEEVLALLSTWAGRPSPDLIILLDIDVEEAALRRGAPSDRIEAKGLDFQRRVAQGYRRYAERDSSAVLVDGRGGAEEVHERVLVEVSHVRG